MSRRETYVPPSLQLLERSELIKQGAEAKVYLLRSLLPSPSIYRPPASSSSSGAGGSSEAGPSRRPPGPPVILKYRFSKKYRHPTLDSSLTKTRLSWEARALARSHRAGVVVPKVLWVDEVNGVLGLEKVEGWSVREILGGGAEGEVEIEDDPEEEELDVEAGARPNGHSDSTGGVQGDAGLGEGAHPGMEALRQVGVTQEQLMSAVGAALARLHSTTLIHGDLTTSNMMVRLTPNGPEPFEIVLIDFGLCSQAQYSEHYAVDLYVLERAFVSTHPASEGLYAGVMEAYGEGMGGKWRDIERKLKEVRLRGRKRDMTG